MPELNSIDSLICILQKCRKKRNLADARSVHAHICNNGLETQRTLGNYIVPMFVDCGSVSDAQQVFNRLVNRSEISWTSLMLGYIEHGHSQHALRLYHKMKQDNVEPSSYTLKALLKACARLKDMETGREIHVEIAQKGFETDLFIGNTLIDMYSKCGSLDVAQQVFDKLPVQNVVSWTALIAGYTEYGLDCEALKCFDQMQVDGVSPNVVTFVCVLKACSRIGALDKGREIHTNIAQKGFERDVFVGSTLIDMYANCCSPTEARQVFDNHPIQDIVLWTALIAAYAEHGPGQEALTCYEQMQLEGVSPDAVTFVCILKACCSVGAIDKGRDVHIDITQRGFENDVFVGSSLVDMYLKCGSLAEAQEIFNKLPVRNVVAWTALITGYAEHGPAQEALRCFEQMQLEGIPPNAVTFVCVLKACGSIGTIGEAQKIHMEITQKGFDSDAFVGNTLVDVYARCGSLANAREVLDSLPVKDVVSWNALIAGHADHGPAEEVLNYFEQMQLEGITPDGITVCCALKACGSIRAIDKGREMHADIAQKGFGRDVFVNNSLIDMYARCGSLVEAQEVLDKLPVRDVVSWTALIAGYVEHGFCQKALNCFEQMQLEGISPNVATFVCTLKACGSMGSIEKGRQIHVEIIKKRGEREDFVGNTLVNMYATCGTLAEAYELFNKLPVRDVVSWNILIAGYAEHGPGQKALECFEQMLWEGIFPNVVTFVCILKACASTRDLDQGRQMHVDIAQQGFERDIFIGNTLVDMYSKCGSIEEARAVFDRLPIQDVVSWNALLAGYVEHGSGQDALKCFEQMQLQGLSPDTVTFICVLKACGSIGAMDRGREIHAAIVQKGLERNASVGITLVDMYAKSGLLSEAREVFDKLPVQDVVSWNAMIKGYGMNHDTNMAVQCFEDMQEQGVKPDEITFTCLLIMCSRAGMVFEGQKFFNLMREDYGIAPTVSHYTCIVDLLAKSGYLYQAEKLARTMTCPLSWTALLSACKIYGEAELGLRCFQQLVQMNPECASPYVLMANIYATGGRWDDARRKEELQKCAGAMKGPASDLIEVNKKPCMLNNAPPSLDALRQVKF